MSARALRTVPMPRATAGPARRLAWAALVVGALYVAVSVYWGAGGTLLLSTVGSSVVTDRHRPLLTGAVWGAVVVKAIAAVLPLAAVQVTGRRWLTTLAWVEAVILTAYGLVLTVTGLLVQSGAVHASRDADHRALAWHAYLWDPWFLVWGLLVLLALRARVRSD